MLKVQGSISIIISDSEKHLDDIFDKMQIMDSILVKKGDQIGKRKALLNRWIYRQKFNNENIDNIIDDFLDVLLSKKQTINILKSNYEEVGITLQIRSDYGQIGFTIKDSMLNKISKLNISLSFDVLSFGMVENI